jgi:hypothetical protein
MEFYLGYNFLSSSCSVSVLVSFLLLWQNTWQKQFKRRHFFPKGFRYFSSWLTGSISLGLQIGRTSRWQERVTEKVSYLIVARKLRETEGAGDRDPSESHSQCTTSSNQIPFSDFYHFPLMTTNYEPTSGLIHWLGHSPHNLTTSQ